MDRRCPRVRICSSFCKNCGSEVSPYITECPYCGHRLRRRAPKLPRENAPASTRRGLFRRRSSRSLGAGPSPARPRRAARRPLAGAIAERPYATLILLAAGCVVWVLLRGVRGRADELVIVGPLRGDWWKLFSSQFAYLNGLYAFFTLLVVAIFGWLLERRLGAIVVLALFLGAGRRGAHLRRAPSTRWRSWSAATPAPSPCWRRGPHPTCGPRGRGTTTRATCSARERSAALLLAVPFVRPEASWLAGVTGGALGLLVGLGLQRVEGAESPQARRAEPGCERGTVLMMGCS